MNYKNNPNEYYQLDKFYSYYADPYKSPRTSSQNHIQNVPSKVIEKIAKDLNRINKKIGKVDQFYKYYKKKVKNQYNKENKQYQEKADQIIILQQKLSQCEYQLFKQKEKRYLLAKKIQYQMRQKSTKRQAGKFTKIIEANSIVSNGSSEYQKTFDQSFRLNKRNNRQIIKQKSSPYLIKSRFERTDDQLQKLIQKFDELTVLQNKQVDSVQKKRELRRQLIDVSNKINSLSKKKSKQFQSEIA